MRIGRLPIMLLAVFVLHGIQALVSAVPPPVRATCRISCTVASIAEWSDTHFEDIDMGELNAKNKQVTGEMTLTLHSNGDVTIMADNSNTAELSFGQHALLTKYKLRCDGSGIKQTGSKPTAWRPFGTFLNKGADIVHIPNDGAVEVTLSVRASIKKICPEDSGQYNAIQTLTAYWKS